MSLYFSPSYTYIYRRGFVIICITKIGEYTYLFAIWFSHVTLHENSSKTLVVALFLLFRGYLWSWQIVVYLAIPLLTVITFLFYCLCKQCHNEILSSHRLTCWQFISWDRVSRVALKLKVGTCACMWCLIGMCVQTILTIVPRLLSQKAYQITLLPFLHIPTGNWCDSFLILSGLTVTLFRIFLLTGEF